ncbi:multicopper oxidase family protein [Paroceanicella profunda]|uniref:Multicopper oxidase family protein n=1 Tax=Paroceanicella profunda TaxID=2579971 RepID=A0A5B8FI13_9RHOB|nr:multicopper oxidase family protein [Paroceanicella profunda]QDL92568.1 multicopper oxidase family protein [Paroceanicella profunda]
MTTFSRRGFLSASVGLSASLMLSGRAGAAPRPLPLTAETRVIDIRGRAATVPGLTNALGGQGLILDPDQPFRVDLRNALAEDTIIHWHGQIPPNDQDGAPNTTPMLRPGELRAYDFTPRPGTFWMHSHVPQQEIALLAAPLIVRRPEDLTEDRQEVVMFLHDFSFRPAGEVLAAITGMSGQAHPMAHAMAPDSAPRAGAAPMSMPMPMPMQHGGAGHGMNMAGMAMDLNDFDFDAYLANDRTLDDPDVVRVERGGRVHLRIINAASMTSFRVDTGRVQGRLIAVDGDPVVPHTASRFPISSGQRLEIVLDLPQDGEPLPVLALREGTRDRAGIVLAPAGRPVGKISAQGEQAAAPVSGDMSLELALQARAPLPARRPTRRHMVMLNGAMDPYVWTINGETWSRHTPIPATRGERVELMFHNMSAMAHPMHLHGHVFQVVAVGDRPIAGAVRDTVLVPPMGSVTVALDAGEPAPWMLHCHHMAHLATGMMTEFAVLPEG